MGYSAVLPEEFHLGEKALGMIQKKLNVSLLQDEAAFIALHIVNASADGSDMTKVLEITKLIGELRRLSKDIIAWNLKMSQYIITAL